MTLELFEEAQNVVEAKNPGETDGILGKRGQGSDSEDEGCEEKLDRKDSNAEIDEIDDLFTKTYQTPKLSVNKSNPRKQTQSGISNIQPKVSELMMNELCGVQSGKKSQHKSISNIDNELDQLMSQISRPKASPSQSDMLDNELGDILPSAKKASRSSLQSTPQLDNRLANRSYRPSDKIKIDFV